MGIAFVWRGGGSGSWDRQTDIIGTLKESFFFLSKATNNKSSEKRIEKKQNVRRRKKAEAD